MLFISYNHKDQQIIDFIASKLENEFGRDQIFFDKWSIQPGDGIIGNMTEGLGKTKYFFYFISENSIASKMVNLEWQSALNLSTKTDLKFIPIRVTDVKPPAILADKLYIDLFNIGIEDTIAQMKLIIQGKNTFKSFDEFENLEVIITQMNDMLITGSITTKYFTENDSNFVFVFHNKFEDINIELRGEMGSYNYTGHTDGYWQDKSTTFQMIGRRIFRPITPKNPLSFSINSSVKINLIGIAKTINETSFNIIPVRIEVNNI